MESPKLCVLMIFVVFTCWIANTEAASPTNSDLKGSPQNTTRSLFGSILGLFGIGKPKTQSSTTSTSGSSPPTLCGHTFKQPSINLTASPRSRQRIVGGTEAVPHSWPWQVSLQKGFWIFPPSHFCGGTLIRCNNNGTKNSSNIVVTAAHCLAETAVNTLKVVAGAHTLSTASSPIQASRTIIHPQYNPETVVNDIGIIVLSQSVSFSDTVQPACLASTTDTVTAGERAAVTGWGTLEEGGTELPDELRQVDVPVISDADCKKAYGATYNSTYMFCAGYLNQAGKDSCQGDSGGPLIFKPADCYTLKGVVSFGFGCAEAAYPGVYTRVSYYRQWIDEQCRLYAT